MDRQETYTVTVVRNVGTPLSFTIKRRKVLYLLTVSILLTGLLLFAAANYLFLRTQAHELGDRLMKSQKRAEMLNRQIAKLDHDRYWRSEEAKIEEHSTVKTALLEQAIFSTEGIWITDRSTLSAEDLQEGTSAEVDRFNAELVGDDLRLSLRLVNTSSPLEAVGGYLFVTLVNRDPSPPLYVSTIKKGTLGENGFPSSYKLGLQYLLKSQTSTRIIPFRLTEINEYYTDVIIFLYSYKGRLINRQVVPLDKQIFLE